MVTESKFFLDFEAAARPLLTLAPDLDTMRERGGHGMTELSRSEKLLAEKTVCVLLVRGEDPDAKPIYAYVAVRADKLKEFMAAQESGVFYPEEYGVIVEAGEGEPSAEVRARMERDYSFNHAAMLDIPDSNSAGDVAGELTRALADKQKKDS